MLELKIKTFSTPFNYYLNILQVSFVIYMHIFWDIAYLQLLDIYISDSQVYSSIIDTVIM